MKNRGTRKIKKEVPGFSFASSSGSKVEVSQKTMDEVTGLAKTVVREMGKVAVAAVVGTGFYLSIKSLDVSTSGVCSPVGIVNVVNCDMDEVNADKLQKTPFQEKDPVRRGEDDLRNFV